MLEWPPQSPDLNPIEHLWHIMKEQCIARKVHAKNRNELFLELQNVWLNITRPICEKLFFSMSDRIN